jgi:hypothetical protein
MAEHILARRTSDHAARQLEATAVWRDRLRGGGTALAILALHNLAFYVAALVGAWLISNTGTVNGKPALTGRHMLGMHWRWDAIHYYSITVGGYTPDPAVVPVDQSDPRGLPAFFPMLPLVIRGVATLLGGLRMPEAHPFIAAEPRTLLAGILVSHVATLLAFALLFQLIREETGDEGIARRAVFYAAIFPLAFFYDVPYTEPLFLAASVGAFLAARRRRWLWAGLCVAVASATRPVGILLLPAMAIELVVAWRRGELREEDWLRAPLGMLLGSLGLGLFMLYLWRSTGDPLAFVHGQANFARETVFPHTTLWRSLRYTLNPELSSSANSYARTVIHTAITVGFLLVSLVSVRRWRPSYLLYGVLLFAMILASPWPDDRVMHTAGRHIMIFFPVYITLARWGRRPLAHQLIVMLFLPLFGLLTALFISGAFVA